MLDKIALTLLIIGGLNWGLVGMFNFDLVAWLFGGQYTALSRTIYIIIAVCAIWCIKFYFDEQREAHHSTQARHPM